MNNDNTPCPQNSIDISTYPLALFYPRIFLPHGCNLTMAPVSLRRAAIAVVAAEGLRRYVTEALSDPYEEVSGAEADRLVSLLRARWPQVPARSSALMGIAHLQICSC